MKTNGVIVLKKLNYDKLELACKIQNELFPKEDGRRNFIESLEKDPYRKEMIYYIVYLGDIPIGVAGLYSYNEYPEDAWLAWFGILSKYRKNGYGGMALDMIIQLAKDKGYKNFRLYTDEFATDAHRLYSSRGMVKELYDNPNDKDEYFIAEIFIYSLSLVGDKVSLWNNKTIGLKEQGEKENGIY